MGNPPFAVVAYRWGNTNAHSYIVGLHCELGDAMTQAESENEDRAGKYGVAVIDSTLGMVYYVASRRGESAPVESGREWLAENVGKGVLAIGEKPQCVAEIVGKLRMVADEIDRRASEIVASDQTCPLPAQDLS